MYDEELTASPTLTPAPERRLTPAELDRLRSARNLVQGQEQVVRTCRAALQEAKRAHRWHGTGGTASRVQAAQHRLDEAVRAFVDAEKRLDEVSR